MSLLLARYCHGLYHWRSHTVAPTWLVWSRIHAFECWCKVTVPFFTHITYQFHYKHCLMQEARGKNGVRKSYHSSRHCVFTCAADNTSIFTGHTVVNPQPIVPALCEVCFISSAVNIIQQNKTCTRSKVWQVCSICSWDGSVYVVWRHRKCS